MSSMLQKELRTSLEVKDSIRGLLTWVETGDVTKLVSYPVDEDFDLWIIHKLISRHLKRRVLLAQNDHGQVFAIDPRSPKKACIIMEDLLAYVKGCSYCRLRPRYGLKEGYMMWDANVGKDEISLWQRLNAQGLIK